MKESHNKRSVLDVAMSLSGRRVLASRDDKDKEGDDKGTRDWSQIPPPGTGGGTGGDESKPQRERNWGGILGPRR